jgi:hypothetical protein
MGFGKQTKGSDGSAQTIVGDRGDHKRGRANAMRRYPGNPSNPGSSEQMARSELNSGGGRRTWAQRRAELN